MHGRGDAIRSVSGFSPPSPQRADAVWDWLATHWYTVIVGISVTVAGVLLATAAIPPVLVPFVLAPLGTVAVTALIAPRSAERSAGTQRSSET